jgi:hypothetical protein
VFVTITEANHYWYQTAQAGDIVEVEPKNYMGRYQLVVSDHNDAYFSKLRKCKTDCGYVNGVARGFGDYRSCWVDGEHCTPYANPQNNNEAITFLLEEE